MAKRFLLFVLLSLPVFFAGAQTGYLKPPKDIEDMVRAKPTPSVNFDSKGEWMLLLGRESYGSVEELAKPELRIAGLRIDPANFTLSRQNFITEVTLKNIKSGEEFSIQGLPSPLKATSFSWNGSSTKISFVQVENDRADLYVIDLATKSASKINRTPLNLILNGPEWYDNESLLYFTITEPADKAPKASLMPDGPTVQENYGKAAPRPTYQDMIKNPFQEKQFEFYTTTQLVMNTGGNEVKIGSPAIYNNISVSPDKQYFLIRTIKKPFSYIVPAGGFPTEVKITNTKGELVKHIADLPSSETAPSGYDNIQDVKRGFQWRADKPATLIWSKPLDGGMIKTNVEYHDAVYALDAPFNGPEKELFKTKERYRGIIWGNDNLAIVSEGLRSQMTSKSYLWNPSTGEMKLMESRNTTDAYSNPGSPLTTRNEYGRNVLWLIGKGRYLYFNNTTGSSPKGDLPFLTRYDLRTGKKDTIWRCPEGRFEYVARVLDAENLTFITRRESSTEMPNYWVKNLKKRIADIQLTHFENPYPQLEGVHKEKIKYTRADGVTLTGELYLPKGYDPKRDGPLPTLIWAYPREYNSASDAAQIRGSEHRFTLLNWGSPIFYVTQGYAVLNNAEMPIVAPDPTKKPNDNFVEQLRMNAEAAVNVLAEMGVGDRNRMAVGGHSYGAFMTANLLAHTNLFKAGIARSGAYNRSLTPFGFQNEDRTYWEAPQLYYDMSPFSFAHQMKAPILLIHGEMDNNTGTYPIQSERMFNAIKGNGGHARYVSLPFESHGYSGMESILHTLAEQYNWLEKYLKNK